MTARRIILYGSSHLVDVAQHYTYPIVATKSGNRLYGSIVGILPTMFSTVTTGKRVVVVIFVGWETYPASKRYAVKRIVFCAKQATIIVHS